MTPDVSVIVAVYNTEDLVPQTLASLREQTLGADRIQVLLVDDGSTDASGRLCDEFAATYPGPVEVVHQPNSGTPAVPFNRGLDLATGRYVFFLGSDDYLWDEALERLVDAADRWSSDVIFGKIVGVDGHGVAQQVYQHGTTEDLDLYTTALPYALNNAKLFRRSLIESMGLRYREDMRQRCDQPFTLTAVVKGRTSMLTDSDYYFAQPRHDRSNVTYTAGYDESLHSTEIVMDTIAELIEPGPKRDHVMRRQFDVSLNRLLDAEFLNGAPDVRAEVIERIGSLADRYLTDSLAKELSVEARGRILCAQRRDEATLREVIDSFTSAEQGAAVPVVVEGDDVFLALPNFRRAGWPDDTFRARRRLKTRVAQTMTPGRTVWRGRQGLTVEFTLQIEGLSADNVEAVLEPVEAEAAPVRSRRKAGAPFKKRGPAIPVVVRQDERIARCSIQIDPSTLAPRTIHTPRFRVTLGGFQYDLPVAVGVGPTAKYARRRWNMRRLIVTVGRDPSGFMCVRCGP